MLFLISTKNAANILNGRVCSLILTQFMQVVNITEFIYQVAEGVSNNNI